MTSGEASARRRGPEVLAPAGDRDCLAAAVAGGADAVYLGLRHFNARGRAGNFKSNALADDVAFLHGHGLRCYVVLNTLLHDDEYPKAGTLTQAAVAAGVDAVIVQDLGLWRQLSRSYPQLERHASTQMTVHEPEQVRALAALGAKRIILARELGLDEVAACCAAARDCGIEVEHFVHGALCYAFSGQCLISNFAGCRSANRGTCAQNCRFDYATEAAEPAETHFSMKDLALIDQIPALAEAGVASLKIEGRLKGPDYVYTVAAVYRAAVDAWVADRPFDAAMARRRLQDVFSRGFTAAPLDGRYDEVGRVSRFAAEQAAADAVELLAIDRRAGRAVLRAQQPIAAGQGFSAQVDGSSVGFLVTAADRQGADRWACRLRLPDRGPRLPVGLRLQRNVDHGRRREAIAALRQLPPVAGERPSLDLRLTCRLGRAPELVAGAVRVVGREPVQSASRRAFDVATATAAIGQLGGSGWRLGRLDCHIDPQVFVPASVVKELRRELLATLGPPPTAAPPVPAEPFAVPAEHEPQALRTELWVAVGSVAAARAAQAAGAAQVWLDGIDCWQAAPPCLNDLPPDCWLRQPPTVVTSPHLAAIGLPVVAGQLGTIRAARAAGLRVQADQYLNCFGIHCLAALAECGVAAAVISFECSCREVAKVVRRRRPGLPRLGLTVHGRLPAMLTRQEHGLAPGERRQLQAVPRDGGLPYELERRPGGQTVLWEARRLLAPEPVQRTAGLVDGWVLELADLSPTQVGLVTAAYRRLAEGSISWTELPEALGPAAPAATFAGHLHRGSRALDDVKDEMHAS